VFEAGFAEVDLRIDEAGEDEFAALVRASATTISTFPPVTITSATPTESGRTTTPPRTIKLPSLMSR
jgi:hypothetical protein